MPTDRGSRMLGPPALGAEQAGACDRTAVPGKSARPAVGVGLHLLSPAFAGMVASDSLAAMGRLPALPRADGRSARAILGRQTRLTAPRGSWRFARIFTV